MDVGVYPYSHGDPLLIDKIVNEFLSQGKFDKLRKECMSDADTKPAYQNLQQRVENTVTQFLKKQVWRPDLNKNQLRDSLRKHILESKFFDAGINRIVDQVVNPNVLATVFLPEVEEVVYNYLSIPRPFDKNPKRDDRVKSSGREYEHKTSQESQKNGRDKGESKGENHVVEEDYKLQDIIEKKLPKDYDNEPVKTEPPDEQRRTEEEEIIKTEPEEESNQCPNVVEKTEIPSDESQESLSRMAVEGLSLNEPLPDSDDSVPLEINEKSLSESRDSEDSIMNQMSPISQGRLTPELEEEPKPETVKEEEKKPLTFIGRIPKIKREDSDSSKSSKTKEDIPRKVEPKTIYSSDESDSSKSYGKSDSDEKRKRGGEKKEEKKRDDAEKKDKKRESSSKSSKDKHKRERSRERHKKSSTSSSSSQRERSSSHHKSSHRHKDSKSRRKEEEKKKSKSADDHGKERNKKEDRRSTDRDSNERERGRSSGSRPEGEAKKREQTKNEEPKGEKNQTEETGGEKEEKPKEGHTETGQKDDVLNFSELLQAGALTMLQFPKVPDDFYVKFNSTGFRYFEEWEKAKLDCEEEFKEFVDEAEKDLSLLSDDDSDIGENFAEENEKTIRNLLRGLGNFRRSLMFDPTTSQFYKWTNSKHYLKFRKKNPRESDESIKENIERGERKRALHLKLINRYRRKAMRTGKPRRRPRIKGGIKEKNENSYGEEGKDTYLGMKTEVPSFGGLYGTEGVNLPDSPEENDGWCPGGEKNEGNRESLSLHLPPSPDSDDVNHGVSRKPEFTGFGFVGIDAKNGTVPRKRVNKTKEEGGGTPKKTKRNYSQKYESQDLYKPRPILNGSRTRGRERGMERAGSPVLR